MKGSKVYVDSSDFKFDGLTLEGLRRAAKMVYEVEYKPPIHIIDQPYLDYLRRLLDEFESNGGTDE